MRKKRLYYNTISALVNQVIALVCGFILPIIIIKTFGSELNGLLSSITQYLGFITLLDAGVGAVVQTAYYQPLANGDNRTISLLFNYSKKFYSILALILICYVGVLCGLFPKLINSDFDSLFTILLIIIISFSSFVQFFFAAPHQLLLNADQRLYIQSNVQTITLVLNTIVGVFLITNGHSIQSVKLASSIIFFLRPLFLSYYVKKHYALDYKLRDKNFNIEQKWNGFAQHCATVVMNNTDVMVLTMLAPLSDVSIYSVYNLVVYGIRQFINAISNGFNSLLGNLLACNEKKLLNETFGLFEWLMHSIVVMIYSMAGVLLVPFILNYTSGVNDAQYCRPAFAALLTLAQAMYCIRIPYNTMVCSAGHYRQTQKSAIIEMILNLLISILLVIRFGLIGVAIGTLIAMIYRSGYFIVYLHRNILKLNYKNVAKQIVADLIQACLIILANFLLCRNIHSENSYLNWLINAVILGCVSAVIIFVFNYLFYKENFKSLKRIHLSMGKKNILSSESRLQ